MEREVKVPIKTSVCGKYCLRSCPYYQYEESCGSLGTEHHGRCLAFDTEDFVHAYKRVLRVPACLEAEVK